MGRLTGDERDLSGALLRLTDIFYEQEVVSLTQTDGHRSSLDATAIQKRLDELLDQVGEVVIDYDLSLADQRPLFARARRAARLRIRTVTVDVVDQPADLTLVAAVVDAWAEFERLALVGAPIWEQTACMDRIAALLAPLGDERKDTILALAHGEVRLRREAGSQGGGRVQ